MSFKSIIAIALLLTFGPLPDAHAERATSMAEQLALIDAGLVPPQLLPEADQRIGIFAFEDADDTGLQNAAATIFSREVLASASQSKVGIITITGDVSSPTTEGNLTYFDKVEKVAAGQNITLAVWGIIRKTNDGVQIDTFLQILPQSLENNFTWKMELPEAMQGDELVTRIRPDRILVYRGVFNASEVSQLRSAHEQMTTLRTIADIDTRPFGKLPDNATYYVREKKADWLLLTAKGAREGWVPRFHDCSGSCENLLKAAGFVANVLTYVTDHRLPEFRQSLNGDSSAIAAQIEILESLKTWDDLDNAASLANAWQQGDRIPPGGAVFANLEALAKIKSGLKEKLQQQLSDGSIPSNRTFNEVRLEQAYVLEIIAGLAEASQYDPGNTDVLHNLEVLFNYVGDLERAALARSLIEEYGSP